MSYSENFQMDLVNEEMVNAESIGQMLSLFVDINQLPMLKSCLKGTPKNLFLDIQSDSYQNDFYQIGDFTLNALITINFSAVYGNALEKEMIIAQKFLNQAIEERTFKMSNGYTNDRMSSADVLKFVTYTKFLLSPASINFLSEEKVEQISGFFKTFLINNIVDEDIGKVVAPLLKTTAINVKPEFDTQEFRKKQEIVSNLSFSLLEEIAPTIKKASVFNKFIMNVKKEVFSVFYQEQGLFLKIFEKVGVKVAETPVQLKFFKDKVIPSNYYKTENVEVAGVSLNVNKDYELWASLRGEILPSYMLLVAKTALKKINTFEGSIFENQTVDVDVENGNLNFFIKNDDGSIFEDTNKKSQVKIEISILMDTIQKLTDKKDINEILDGTNYLSDNALKQIKEDFERDLRAFNLSKKLQGQKVSKTKNKI